MPETFSLQGRRIWVAGHAGLVGSAVVRRLQEGTGAEILTVAHSGLDLRRQNDVEAWMQDNRPDAIILAAARVGGIMANSTYPAEFLYDNLAIAQNVIHQAHVQGVRKLLYLGSSCIYPRMADQPIREEALLSGSLEPTNEAYAIAKIAGVKLCQFYKRQYGDDFISLMPCNLYGLGDCWDETRGHVIPGLMVRFEAARSSGAARVTVWGSGAPLREFLYCDDLADAAIIALQKYSGEIPLNAGSGREVSIRDLAQMIRTTVGYVGDLAFDPSKPDGTPRKVLDSSRLRALGWQPRTGLEAGLEKSYADLRNRLVS